MFARLLLALLLVPAVLLGPVSAAAQPADENRARLEARAADMVAVLRKEMPAGEVFTDRFVAAVPPAQLETMISQLAAQMGPLVAVESIEPVGPPGGANIVLRFEQALGYGQFKLEAGEPFKVEEFLLTRFEPILDESIPVIDQVRAVPGSSNLLLARLDGSQTMLEHNADMPLAIGSAFKLYVLFALVQEIAQGRRAWDDVVELDARSFPSGMLQDWPEGTPLTLQTLAALMISISDNTAADQLIATLGRETIEAELVAAGNSAPAMSIPFLTTRELFLLKGTDETEAARYATLDTAERRALLEALAQRDISLQALNAAFSGGPRAIDVEWFASPKDIARLFDRLKDDPVALGIMGINTVFTEEESAGWDYVGYKGGSETGVLNMSWLLRDGGERDGGERDGGDWYVLTLGWNNPDAAVETSKLLSIARRALAELGHAS